jgi:hypothetical protein
MLAFLMGQETPFSKEKAGLGGSLTSPRPSAKLAGRWVEMMLRLCPRVFIQGSFCSPTFWLHPVDITTT